MPQTKQKLAEEVLLELGVADATDPGESEEDIAFVKRRYDGLYAALEEKAFWDLDSIPDRVFAPLAQHVAFSVRLAFGQGGYAPSDEIGRTPLQQIEAISSQNENHFETKIEYF